MRRPWFLRPPAPFERRAVRAEVVWLDGSKEPPGSPIRRRWRLSVKGRTVLSLPLTTVEWSR